MGRKKEKVQPNIRRYTIQMDEKLYRKIHSSSVLLQVKTYELVNRLVLLGARTWDKLVVNKEAHIDTGDRRFSMARTLETRVIAREKTTEK